MEETHEVSPVNPNRALIDGMRQAADFLETNPMPALLGFAFNHVYTKDEFLRFFREMGAFEKIYTDNEIRIRRKFGDVFYIEVSVNRERICRKVVKWECPDEGLLELATQMVGEAEK